MLKPVRQISILLTMTMLACCAKEAEIVKPGVDVLFESQIDLLKGKNVGLITNPTGVNSRMESTVDLFFNHPEINLVALFGPEHGVRGDITGGFLIDDSVDPKTGVPVFSLYGKNRKPTPEMLKNIDVLVYDIQDIGSRAYTYIYTMALSMKAAAAAGKKFIVLDRPNPLGGNLIEGPVLDMAFASTIGMYPIPFVYGMTVGELAQYFNSEFGINVDLTVVPLKNWKREMTGDETGLEWVITSPHIPHARSALFCAATGCIGELHTIDIGIGYTLPFELIGEEWIKADELSNELNSYQLPGVLFRPMYYKPYYYTRKDAALQGVQVHVLDNTLFKPMMTQIYILTAIHKLYPYQKFFETKRTSTFDKAMGTDKVRQEIWDGKPASEIINSWDDDLKTFINKRAKYLIY